MHSPMIKLAKVGGLCQTAVPATGCPASTKPRLSLLQRMTLAHSGKQSGSLRRGPSPHMLQRLTGAMPSRSQRTSGLPWANLACMVSTLCRAEVFSAPGMGDSLACVLTYSDAVHADAGPVSRQDWLAGRVLCAAQKGYHCTLQA